MAEINIKLDQNFLDMQMVKETKRNKKEEGKRKREKNEIESSLSSKRRY